jgi:hypothetical protein
MKLVHLVGFITKKFVTMYGHMKVKIARYDYLLLSLFSSDNLGCLPSSVFIITSG